MYNFKNIRLIQLTVSPFNCGAGMAGCDRKSFYRESIQSLFRFFNEDSDRLHDRGRAISKKINLQAVHHTLKWQ
jgi:hypothetical protein